MLNLEFNVFKLIRVTFRQETSSTSSEDWPELIFSISKQISHFSRSIYRIVISLNTGNTLYSRAAACLSRYISQSMAAMLGVSVVDVLTRPRALLLTIFTLRKAIHRFPQFTQYFSTDKQHDLYEVTDTAGLRPYGPSGRQSSAITNRSNT